MKDTFVLFLSMSQSSWYVNNDLGFIDMIKTITYFLTTKKLIVGVVYQIVYDAMTIASILSKMIDLVISNTHTVKQTSYTLR